MNNISLNIRAGVSILAAFLLVFAYSCTKEEITPNENLAFSSNGNPPPAVPVGGDEIFQSFKLTNGKSNWSNGGVYYLGLVSDEKVREVYIWAEGKSYGNVWQRVDPVSGNIYKGSFDPDAHLRNTAGLFNPAKTGFRAFDVGPLVYVTFGNKYGALRVDQGEVFRDAPSGNFPSGITNVDYLPFRSTADFNGGGVWIGVTTNAHAGPALAGYVAGSSNLNGPYLIPGLELGTPNTASDVNYSATTAGNVTGIDVTGYKRVVFSLANGTTKVGFAQRGGNEFIKVD